MSEVSGVYGIFNADTGFVYIGASKTALRRCRSHTTALRYGNHDSQKLQRDWNKNHSFYIVILSRVDNFHELEKAEAAWLEKFPFHYNVFPPGRGITPGCVIALESRAKMSSSKLGTRLSESHRQHISEGGKGKVLSKETRQKIRIAHLGMKASEATRQKMSLAVKNRPPITEATRIKLANHARKVLVPFSGRKMSQETKNKISAANKGKVISEAQKQKISSTLQGHPVSPETCSKISQAIRDFYKRTKGKNNG